MKTLTKDMTTGSPVRHILAFAVPLFFSNLLQQVYNIGDMMITGYNLGHAVITAKAATSSFYSLLLNFSWGLNGGYGIVVSQCFGSHNRERLRSSVAAMLVLNAIGTVLLTALSLALLHPALDFLNTPAEIYDQAFIYIFITCAGLCTTLAYNMLAGFLRAVGNSTAPLWFLLASCLINLVADLILIAGLGFGIAVSALTSVLGQACASALCARYIWKHYQDLLPKRANFAWDRKLYLEMFTTGISMAAMNCIYAVGSLVLQRAINALGNAVITAQASAQRVVMVLMMPLNTVSNAVSVFVGQNWGAREPGRIRSALRKSLFVEVAWGLIAAALVFLCGREMIALLTATTDADVLANAVMNLRINFVFFPALGVLLCLRMAMQAMGHKIAPLFSSGLELAFKVVSSLFVIPLHGYVAASFTEPASWLACALLLGSIYLAHPLVGSVATKAE